MNVQLSSHREAHHVTGCIHEHHSVERETGGMKIQSGLLKNASQEPRSLEETLANLTGQLEQSVKGRGHFGEGYGPGTIEGGVQGQGKDIFQQQSVASASAQRTQASCFTVPWHRISYLISPAVTRVRNWFAGEAPGREKVSGMLSFSSEAVGNCRKSHWYIASRRLRRSVSQWLRLPTQNAAAEKREEKQAEG